MSCFDSTFPKFSPPLSFSQKTKLSVSYFDVKVWFEITIFQAMYEMILYIYDMNLSTDDQRDDSLF